MSQRYRDPLSHERMSANTCPECGSSAEHHNPSREFWVPRECSLTPEGVRDRITQWEEDQDRNATARIDNLLDGLKPRST